MRNTEKRGRFSGLLKIFSNKLHGKETPKKIDTSKMSEEYFCNLVLVELGGIENLSVIDSCITRLRLDLKNRDIIDEEMLKKLGSKGIMISGLKVSMVFGDVSIAVKETLEKKLGF